ncbi:ABC transporter permease [Duganella sp. BJB488]|uniref:MlaE family ABC transporter permease n=1 Tax=unclassified Duganella TaxID=2636909 RepID=UPI000E344D08|nr:MULTISPECIES: ABC transporter permease [unclassified Duganella]MCU6502040.1 ABC transporter permease [Rugamonas sp. A1-17]NVD74967.1 ABC transporter permease [Duganella sp. BJB1802]RFP09157.1 ABC transporter permease [Duganella sp. BJB489]RFP12587.1 ABC transporter permease [Duganella sp. BJB488]RFP29154.1 ABC transporter permease [Duganella sp. BJB480]
MPIAKEPTLTLNPGAAKGPSVAAGGTWQVHALAQGKTMATITGLIKTLKADGVKWDLTAIDSMDHIGAQLLWNAWGKTRPADLQLAPGQEEFFNRLESTGKLELPAARPQRLTWVMKLGFAMLLFFEHLIALTSLIGQVVQELWRFARAPMRGPWKEISANIFHAGFQALGITALVGFLIGVVFSYLSAQQLRNFGGDIFLVNLLGMSIIRELGPLLAAILVAGRSGSSITAQLGVMRVTEELDAMLVMGISHGFRLIMPKVLALAIAMPLLVIWTDTIALLGGMVSAKVELNLSPQYFILKLPDAVPLANYMIGLGKGTVFGILIALVSCHFGLRIKPNTESLGRGTTTSVVTAITAVILADAVFAIVFSGVGF